MEEKTAKKVMLSGIQPSGDLTLDLLLKCFIVDTAILMKWCNDGNTCSSKN